MMPPSSADEGGFFVEAGAYDGEFISHTLRFEIMHKWVHLLSDPVKPTKYTHVGYQNISCLGKISQ